MILNENIMKRTDYIRRTLRAICGSRPAQPNVYHIVERMANSIANICPFDDGQK